MNFKRVVITGLGTINPLGHNVAEFWENKRQRRTPQERANELDEKITKINQSINELEEKKKTV